MKHLFSDQIRTVTVRLVDNEDDEDALKALDKVLVKGQKFVVAYDDVYYETVVSDGTKKFSELPALAGESETAAPTGASVALTGYEIGTEGAVADTDTVNDAIGKLEARLVALETV